MTTTSMEIIRRDDTTINCVFKDADGNAINITGYTIFFTVKENLDDSDSDAKISKTVSSHTDPTNGATQITLSATDTNIDEGTYYYDFQMKTSGGTIQSTKRGILSVVQDVTVRTS